MELLDNILSMLRNIKDNPAKLQELHDFMIREIYEEEDEDDDFDVDDALQVPEKYQAVVKEAADLLAADMICFINAETLELVTIPALVMDEIEWNEEDETDEELETDEFEESFDDFAVFKKDLNRINTEWKKVIRIEQPQSHESFRFMEQFAHSLSDAKVRHALGNALQRSKPFKNFNAIIQNSTAREAWFNFKQKCLEKYVFDAISRNLIDEGEK